MIKSRIVVTICAFIASLLCFLFIGCNLVSDAKLTERFKSNRTYFDRIVAMSQEDKHVVTINMNSTDLDANTTRSHEDRGLSQARWDEYRALLRRLGTEEGLARRKDFPSAIFLYAECQGSAIDAYCKGYVYSESSLSPIAENLNSLPKGMLFKPLASNWYLFREER